MAFLSVKLDHVAALRQARRGKTPDPSQAAVLAELGGADGIVVHLRRDRRYIRERDLYLLKEIVGTRLTLEIAPVEDNVSRAAEVKPFMVIFTPEADNEVTTLSGFATEQELTALEEMGRRLQESGVKVGLHIDSSADIVKKASAIRVDAIKLYTGIFAGAQTEREGLAELEQIEKAARAAHKAGMMVIAGQGLDYQNLPPLVKLGVIDEFMVGHAVVARSLLVGMERAVQEIATIVRADTGPAGS